MPALRGKRKLICFYCGRRSNFTFEGQAKFNCDNCEATNWLDEQGEITDPPTVDRTPVQYAIPRAGRTSISPPSTSPGSAHNDSLFCATCLRNQHMLRSSLNQFEWPEDSTGTEYLAREKKYHLLRRDLEKRYPQVCAACEPRVEKRLHQASYTAQTDHLKRMMTKTKSQRNETKSWSALDMLDIGGKWAWQASYMVQLAWHLLVICVLLVNVMQMAESMPSWIAWIVPVLGKVIRVLPSSNRMLSWATNLGLCSFPWNPRFKQSIRGFTAHIMGFKQWYTYQLLALLVRLVALSASQYAESQGITASAQLGAQVFLVVFTVYVYRMAPGSIRTDTTPLFRQPPKHFIAEREPVSSPQPAKNEPSSLADALDDILREPPRMSSLSPAPVAAPRPIARAPLMSSPFSAQNQQRPMKSGDSSALFGSMSLSGAPSRHASEPPAQVHYEEEMDWSPSTSQHRAFNTYNTYNVKNPNPRFGDTPVEPKAGPIWYKVPPAPTNPAQRLRNPQKPIIRETIKQKEAPSIFARDYARQKVDLGSPFKEKDSSLNIAEPKFYAPETRNDPRDGLSSIFASSFNIVDSEESTQSQSQPGSGTDVMSSSAMSREKVLWARVPELVVLLGALYAWNIAAKTTETYGLTVSLAALCACLMVSLRLTADLLVEEQLKTTKPVSILKPSWASLAVLQVLGSLVLLTLTWSGGRAAAPGIVGGFDFVMSGNLLLGVVVAHHLKHVLT